MNRGLGKLWCGALPVFWWVVSAMAAPPVLRAVTATMHDPSCARITWQEVRGATEYRVDRRAAEGSCILVGKVGAVANAADRPNVLMIVVDDLNDWTSVFAKDNPIQTPNLEKLAARGAFFNRAYCPSPACNPSRAAVLTGTRPHHSGVYGNAADWRRALPQARTLQRYFKDHGWFVGGAGKIFHHHLDWAFHDNASFHEFLMLAINEPYPDRKLNGFDWFGSRNTDWGVWPDDIRKTPDYRTAAYAVEFLQRRHDQPFFLNVGIYKPHSPFFAPQKYFDRYPKERVAMPEMKRWLPATDAPSAPDLKPPAR